jgi:hypothetical protein
VAAAAAIRRPDDQDAVKRIASRHCVGLQPRQRLSILELDGWIFQKQQNRMDRMTTLDVDAVRSFIAIADHQSFTRAADALGTTQGAVSVKLKRLENHVGQKLIERTPRQVRLSA